MTREQLKQLEADLWSAADNLRANPATSFDNFEKAKLLVLSDDLLKSFHEKIEPLFRQKHLLQQLCEWLKQTRENLLPRLISGKLPVENLDIQFPPGMAEELKASVKQAIKPGISLNPCGQTLVDHV